MYPCHNNFDQQFALFHLYWCFTHDISHGGAHGGSHSDAHVVLNFGSGWVGS